MFGLIPKEEKFFRMFQEMGVIITEGAQQLKTMLDDYADPQASQRQIKDTEHKGDNQTHLIIRTLNKTFITPLDREDIYSLASKLDDILDLVDACAQRFVMYNVENRPPPPRSWPSSSSNHARPWSGPCIILAASLTT